MAIQPRLGRVFLANRCVVRWGGSCGAGTCTHLLHGCSRFKQMQHDYSNKGPRATSSTHIHMCTTPGSLHPTRAWPAARQPPPCQDSGTSSEHSSYTTHQLLLCTCAATANSSKQPTRQLSRKCKNKLTPTSSVPQGMITWCIGSSHVPEGHH